MLTVISLGWDGKKEESRDKFISAFQGIAIVILILTDKIDNCLKKYIITVP